MTGVVDVTPKQWPERELVWQAVPHFKPVDLLI